MNEALLLLMGSGVISLICVNLAVGYEGRSTPPSLKMRRQQEKTLA